MNFFEGQLENAYLECKEIIVMGDFNVHLLSLEEKFVSLLEVMNLFSLKQIIEEPTRITPYTASLIDHIYVSNPERVQAVKVSRISISDHFPTTFVYKASSGNKQCHFVTKFAPSRILMKLYFSMIENLCFGQYLILMLIQPTHLMYGTLFFSMLGTSMHHFGTNELNRCLILQ